MLIAVVAAVIVCAFLFTRGLGNHAAAPNGAKASPIGVVVPYQPPPAPPPPPAIKTVARSIP
ncbi:MAG: hypothetical protein ACREFU_21135, partial [Acetobacteraceae bacterium]